MSVINNVDEGVQYYVQVRQYWANTWENATWLVPEQFENLIAPGIGRAILTHHAGYIKRESEAAYNVYPGYDINGWYVRILTRYSTDDIKVRFVGKVVDRQDIMRDSSGFVFDQIYTAFEMGYDLDRIPVDRALVRNSADAINPISLFGYTPAFNKKAEFGGRLTGNKSPNIANTPPFLGCHYFYELNDAEIWSAYDILIYIVQYLLKDPGGSIPWYQFTAHDWSGKTFLSGQYAFLSGIYRVWDLSEKTVWGALNEIINRSAGFAFRLDIDINDNFVIHVKSVSLTTLTLGLATIPENTDTTLLYLPTDFPFTHLVNDLSARQSYSSTYGLIEVIGGPISVTTTWECGADKELVPAWDTGKETEYQDVDGDDADEKDQARAHEKYEGFYTKFVLRDDWDGYVTRPGLGKLYIIPAVNPYTGVITFPQQASAVFLGDKRFEREISLAAGYDYAVFPPAWMGGNQARDEMMPMIGFIWDQLDGDLHTNTDQWVQMDRVHEYIPDLRGSYSIRPTDKQVGVEWSASPRHLFALGYWDDDIETNVYPEFSYLNVRVTATLKTDVRLQAKAVINNDLKHKKLTIHVEDAEAWAVLPNTVISGGTGEVYAGSLFVRDDTPILAGIAAAAASWHTVPRQATSIEITRVDQFVSLGQVIVAIIGIGTNVPVNSIVTSIRTDIVQGKTIIETNWGDEDYSPDFGRFFP